MAGIGEVGERLRRSTVEVRTRGGGGSGVVWETRGVIITNAHVVGGAAEAVIRLWDGRELSARVVRRDRGRDLAQLQVGALGLEAAPVGDPGGLRIGEMVIAVGNPMGFVGALSTGVVHAVGPLWGAGDLPFVQATVRLAPGNSGGPLAIASGNVIGINTMIVSGGLALAVPASDVESFLAAAPPVELGVTVRAVRIPDAPSGIGWLVLEVAANSPADRASLQVGDILTGANGRPFDGLGDFAQALRGGSGGRLSIRFRRGKSPREREVTVQLVQGLAA